MPSDLSILADYNEPILFRTVDAQVYQSTLDTGSLWLRSDEYYRDIEDAARQDGSEGLNMSLISLPIRIARPGATTINIEGDGRIGMSIRPHYIASFHGLSIDKQQMLDFGEHTFGVKSLSRLSAEVLSQACLQLRCVGYRYGAVAYQRTNLALILGW